MGRTRGRVAHDRLKRQPYRWAARLKAHLNNRKQLVYRTEAALPHMNYGFIGGAIKGWIIAPSLSRYYGTVAYGATRAEVANKLRDRLNKEYGFIGRLVHESVASDKITTVTISDADTGVTSKILSDEEQLEADKKALGVPTDKTKSAADIARALR